MIHEHVCDRCKTRRKPPEPTVCLQCGAVFQEGRWHWAPRPSPAHEELCLARQRIIDRCPAGELTIAGEFASRHRARILHLARHHGERAMAEHPLHRIAAVEERGGAAVVQTTDPHLPLRIGKALRRAYRGKLDCHHDEAANLTRVRWSRDR